jgi:peptidoglycan/xylan/chitin deacetylase (PgdA/CDA1 family)
MRDALAAALADPSTPEGAAVADSAAGIPYDSDDGIYRPASGNPIPGIDETSYNLPEKVRAALAENLASPSSVEGAAVQQVAAANADAAAQSVAATAAAAKSMAIRGFVRKSSPPKSMWAFPGASGHGFTSAGSTGAAFNLNDTTDYVLGTQSVSMTTAGADGTYARLSKTGITVDATGQYVRVWIKIDDITKVPSVALLLGDSTLANYFTTNVHQLSLLGASPERKSFIKSGAWTVIDIPWSAFVVGAGSPSRSNISGVALLAYGSTASGPQTVHWNGVAGVSERSTFPNGVISLTFDDTHDSAFTVARPYMDRYGFPGTLFPIHSNFGQPGFLTEAQAKALYSTNGWDFGYHASTQNAHDAGFDTFNEAQLVEEFEKQRAWASQRGITGDSFAWPQAYFNPLAETVAARYFQSARLNGMSSVEVLPPTIPTRVRPILGNAAATSAGLNALVDQVKSGKGWGVVTFHRLVASGATSNDMNTATFQAFVDYVKAQGVAVATVSQVMAAL